MDRPPQTTGEQFLITKRCGFGEQIHWFRVDRRSIRFQNYRDSCGQASLNNWCGRDLNLKTLYVKLYRRYVREQVASTDYHEVFHFKI